MIAARETSADEAAPIELYEFVRGADSEEVEAPTWFYTSAAEDVTHNNKTYRATALKRSRIEQTRELARSRITIDMAVGADVVRPFIAAPPLTPTSVKVSRMHHMYAGTAVIWMGRIVDVAFRRHVAQITCEPNFTSVLRTGLRRFYQPGCPHVLYSSDCGASAPLFLTAAKVLAVEKNTITAAEAGAKPDGHFSGGYIIYENGATRAMILSHLGISLTLAVVPHSLGVGDDIAIYPGCDHRLTTCKDKFNNLENFGGFPYMPDKNPFDTAVF